MEPEPLARSCAQCVGPGSNLYTPRTSAPAAAAAADAAAAAAADETTRLELEEKLALRWRLKSMNERLACATPPINFCR